MVIQSYVANRTSEMFSYLVFNMKLNIVDNRDLKLVNVCICGHTFEMSSDNDV